MSEKSNLDHADDDDADSIASASLGATAASNVNKPNYPGPKPDVKYPLTLIYCGECGLPVDLCEYSQNPEACKDWLDKNHPGFYSQINNLQINESTEDGGEKKSAHQKRGGKAIPKSKKEKVPSKVVIMKEKRKGNKFVTVITGLLANDIELEVAKKFFAQKFACSCSKGEGDELIIQGDVVDNLFDVIPEKYSQITSEMMELKEK